MKTLFLSSIFYFGLRQKALLSTLLLCLSFTAFAQQVSSSDEEPFGKSAIGIGFRVMPFDAIGTPDYQMPALDVPFIHLNYNYKLSNRTNLQIGLGYGFNEVQQAGISRHIKVDSIYMKESYQRLSAIAIPLTFRWSPFNTAKRLQVYGNASIVPVLRTINAKATESLNGGSSMRTELYNNNTTDFTAIAAAGITLQYSFSHRWSTFIEADLIYYNFDRNTSTTSFMKGSKGVGLNYNFNLKREK